MNEKAKYECVMQVPAQGNVVLSNLNQVSTYTVIVLQSFVVHLWWMFSEMQVKLVITAFQVLSKILPAFCGSVWSIRRPFILETGTATFTTWIYLCHSCISCLQMSLILITYSSYNSIQYLAYTKICLCYANILQINC